MSRGRAITGGVVLVAGHESRHGGDLWPVSASIPGAVLTTPGRPLHRAVGELLAAGADDIAVLPMTWGRDPVLIADTAQTLRWVTTGEGRGRVALCRPLGATDHLVTLLRKAANDVTESHPDAALVVTGYRSNPFDDAELHRIGHLVRAYGNGSDIEIACIGDESDIERAVLRTRLLGFRSTVLVPADFARTMPAVDVIDKVWFHGPLLPAPALLRLIGMRVTAARHSLAHGDDGISAGLLADHDHGFAHSHDVDGHPHPHSHGPGGHDHVPGHSHDTRRTEESCSAAPPTSTTATTSRSMPAAPPPPSR